MDIPRIFNITESAHRIHNPFTPEKLATLGAALRLETGTRVLDLGSGSGEMLCTWARDYGVIGTGIEPSDALCLVTTRRDHDDRDVHRGGIRFQSGADFEAVHARHHGVEQHDVAPTILA